KNEDAPEPCVATRYHWLKNSPRARLAAPANVTGIPGCPAEWPSLSRTDLQDAGSRRVGGAEARAICGYLRILAAWQGGVTLWINLLKARGRKTKIGDRYGASCSRVYRAVKCNPHTKRVRHESCVVFLKISRGASGGRPPTTARLQSGAQKALTAPAELPGPTR